MNIGRFRELALELPQVTEHAQLGLPDFRILDKVIATLAPVENRAAVKLTAETQAARLKAEPDIFYPAKGDMGVRGWTNIVLDRASDETVKSALRAAWLAQAPPKLKRAFGDELSAR